MIQEVVWTVSIVLMGALAAVFAWVAAGANVALADYGPVVDSAYRLRTWLFTLVFLILIAVTYQTLGKLPYRRVGAHFFGLTSFPSLVLSAGSTLALQPAFAPITGSTSKRSQVGR